MVIFENAPHDDDNVQDLWYALQEAGLLSGDLKTATSGDSFKTRGYGLQPDGSLVGEMATGQLFSEEVSLSSGETYTSDWFDTTGFSSVEVFVGSDSTSATNGVEFEFTDEVGADSPEVLGTSKKEYDSEAAEEGYEFFAEETHLDGFRFKFTNGNTSVTNVDIIGTANGHLSLDGANYVDSNTLGNNIVRVGTDENSRGLKVGEPQSLFGDIVTINRKTVIDLTSSFGTSHLRDEISTTGSASVSEDPDPSTGEIVLSTGTTANSNVSVNSAEYGRYVPGYSAQQGVGIRIPNPPTEGEALWGYYDDNNGFYWGYDGSQEELFVARLNNGSEVNRVYRSNWNRNDITDVLDNNWDVERGSIFQIDFSWYGYGIILFSVVSQTSNDLCNENPRQESVVVHAEVVKDDTSTVDPNHPITVEAGNGPSGEDYDLRFGGRQFSVFGEMGSEKRITTQHSNTNSVNDTEWTHIMSWQRKSGEKNARLNTESFDTIQTGDTRYAIVINANVSSTSYQSPDLTPSGETLLEVSTDGSFDGIGDGSKVWEGMNAGGGGNISAGSDSNINVRFGQSTVVTLLARAVDASSTVDATMRMTEDW